MDKNIADILKIARGKIEDVSKIRLREIDTIVNDGSGRCPGA